MNLLYQLYVRLITILLPKQQIFNELIMKDYRSRDFRSYEYRTQEYSSSPRKEIATRQYVPKRQMISQQLDQHTSKIKELLRADISMLQQQNSILKTKIKMIPQLQNKIQSVMRQKAELLAQNERIGKMFHQQRSQYEVLKKQFDMQNSQRQSAQTGLEFQNKKLRNQIDHLNGQINELQRIKNAQISETRSQCSLQLQTLRRQQASSQQIYEMDIRKLKQLLEKKEYELNDALNSIKRLSNDSDYEINKLRDERQKLRNEVISLQADRKREIQSLRMKLQSSYYDEIETIKKSHINSVGSFEMENIKMKEALENRCLEIEQLVNKNSKQKQLYEQNIMILKRENDSYRQKLVDLESGTSSQVQQLRIKLAQLHQGQIEEISRNHQRQTEALGNEIANLQNSLSKKSAQIEELIKQKSLIRHSFQGQLSRLKEECQTYNLVIKDLQNSLRRTTQSFEQKIRDKNSHIEYLQKMHNELLANNQSEQQSLKDIIEGSKRQIESERISAKEKQQQIKEELNETKNQLYQTKEQLRNLRDVRSRAVEQMKDQYEGLVAQLKTRIQSKEIAQKTLNKQLQALRQALTLRERQNNNLKAQVKRSDEDIRKAESANDELKVKLAKKDQKAIQMLNQQKNRLENAHAFVIENLKNDHQSSVLMQQNKIQDLRKQMKKKQTQLENFLRAYKKMRDQLEQIMNQQATRKDMTLKYPGATAELVAVKNMFDVYLKTKVLDICGDAKQNIQGFK